MGDTTGEESKEANMGKEAKEGEEENEGGWRRDDAHVHLHAFHHPLYILPTHTGSAPRTLPAAICISTVQPFIKRNQECALRGAYPVIISHEMPSYNAPEGLEGSLCLACIYYRYTYYRFSNQRFFYSVPSIRTIRTPLR